MPLEWLTSSGIGQFLTYFIDEQYYTDPRLSSNETVRILAQVGEYVRSQEIDKAISISSDLMTSTWLMTGKANLELRMLATTLQKFPQQGEKIAEIAASISLALICQGLGERDIITAFMRIAGRNSLPILNPRLYSKKSYAAVFTALRESASTVDREVELGALNISSCILDNYVSRMKHDEQFQRLQHYFASARLLNLSSNLTGYAKSVALRLLVVSDIKLDSLSKWLPTELASCTSREHAAACCFVIQNFEFRPSRKAAILFMKLMESIVNNPSLLADIRRASLERYDRLLRAQSSTSMDQEQSLGLPLLKT
jgi:hypothetical protein